MAKKESNDFKRGFAIAAELCRTKGDTGIRSVPKGYVKIKSKVKAKAKPAKKRKAAKKRRK